MAKKTYIALDNVVLWAETQNIRGDELSHETINANAENIDALPSIVLDLYNRLLAGFHRYYAHQRARRDRIAYTVEEFELDTDAIEYAISSNAKHGLPYSAEAVKRNAIRLCELGYNNKKIAGILSRHQTVIGKYVKATSERMQRE